MKRHHPGPVPRVAAAAPLLGAAIAVGLPAGGASALQLERLEESRVVQAWAAVESASVSGSEGSSQTAEPGQPFAAESRAAVGDPGPPGARATGSQDSALLPVGFRATGSAVARLAEGLPEATAEIVGDSLFEVLFRSTAAGELRLHGRVEARGDPSADAVAAVELRTGDDALLGAFVSGLGPGGPEGPVPFDLAVPVEEGGIYRVLAVATARVPFDPRSPLAPGGGTARFELRVVPEPATPMLIAAGLLVLAAGAGGRRGRGRPPTPSVRTRRRRAILPLVGACGLLLAPSCEPGRGRGDAGIDRPRPAAALCRWARERAGRVCCTLGGDSGPAIVPLPVVEQIEVPACAEGEAPTVLHCVRGDSGATLEQRELLSEEEVEVELEPPGSRLRDRYGRQSDPDLACARAIEDVQFRCGLPDPPEFGELEIELPACSEVVAAPAGLPFCEDLEAIRDAVGCTLLEEDEDGPTACFGIFPGDAPGVGHIWALGSGAIDRHPVAFARLSRDLVRQAPEWGYLVLGNVMDASNAHRLKWLDRLGFRIYRYIDIGPNGAYEFIKTL